MVEKICHNGKDQLFFNTSKANLQFCVSNRDGVKEANVTDRGFIVKMYISYCYKCYRILKVSVLKCFK